MVGDGTWLTVREASTRLGVSDQTARNYADDDLLFLYRLAGRHRRFEAASVDALLPVLRMPLGPDRDAAMDELRRVNRAKVGTVCDETASESESESEEEPGDTLA